MRDAVNIQTVQFVADGVSGFHKAESATTCPSYFSRNAAGFSL